MITPYETTDASSSIDVSTMALWKAYNSSPISRTRRVVDSLMHRSDSPRALEGYCDFCQTFTAMEVRAQHVKTTDDGNIKVSFSETFVCKICNLNSRMRFCFEQVNNFIEQRSIRDVYISEAKTAFYECLNQRNISLRGSEWLGNDKIPGESYDGIQHQDIHNLSFNNESFDLVISLDVIEHVNSPEQAINEIFRVLRDKGVAIITFPFYPGLERSIRRAELDQQGNIVYILKPVFHGNPLGGGSLVYNDFGWDFINSLIARYGSKVKLVQYWSLYRAHFGQERFALILTKN